MLKNPEILRLIAETRKGLDAESAKYIYTASSLRLQLDILSEEFDKVSGIDRGKVKLACRRLENIIVMFESGSAGASGKSTAKPFHKIYEVISKVEEHM